MPEQPYAFEDIKIRFHSLLTFSNTKTTEKNLLHKVSALYKLMYVFAGETKIRYSPETDPGAENLSVLAEVALRAGDFLFMPPKTYYSTENGDGVFEAVNLSFWIETEEMRREGFTVAESHPLQYVARRAEDVKTILKKCFFAPSVRLCDVPALSSPSLIADGFGGRATVVRLGEEATRRFRLHIPVCDALMTELLVGLIRFRDGGSVGGDAQIADLAIGYINEHKTEKLSCQSLARILGYHPNYLNAIVRRRTGMTLHRYITDTKLQQAKLLVLSTDMPIAEIAALLWFSDASSFTKSYYRKFGILPLRHRRNVRFSETK